MHLNFIIYVSSLGAIRSLSRTTPAGLTHLSPLERSRTHPLPWRIPRDLSLEGIVNLTQPNKSRLSLEDVTAPLSLEEALSTHSAVLGGSAGSFRFYHLDSIYPIPFD